MRSLLFKTEIRGVYCQSDLRILSYKCSCENEMISMSRVWDKQRIWVPDGFEPMTSQTRGLYSQCAKKMVSDNPPRLAGFAIGLVNSVFNLPDGKVMLFEEISKHRRTVKSILLVKKFLGLVEMTSGLVNASFSLPEWHCFKNDFLCTLVHLSDRNSCQMNLAYGLDLHEFYLEDLK